jgi:integration host factor alpha subunit
MVELVLKEITDSLEKGEAVKLSSFGSFIVRKKKQRTGRNPKTGTEVPILPRRVVVFKPSAILKQRINGKRSGAKTPVAELGSSAPAETALKQLPLFARNGDGPMFGYVGFRGKSGSPI